MKGRKPKAPGARARRNKPAVSARMETREQASAITPPLGTHPRGETWHPRTLLFWEEVWSSPMAAEYLRADIDGLLQLATLVDDFWREPSSKLAAEIRLQRQCFGLTPIDRRRLQWEVVRAEEAEQKRPGRKAPAKPEPTADPRGVLKAI